MLSWGTLRDLLWCRENQHDRALRARVPRTPPRPLQRCIYQLYQSRTIRKVKVRPSFCGLSWLYIAALL